MEIVIAQSLKRFINKARELITVKQCNLERKGHHIIPGVKILRERTISYRHENEGHELSGVTTAGIFFETGTLYKKVFMMLVIH